MTNQRMRLVTTGAPHPLRWPRLGPRRLWLLDVCVAAAVFLFSLPSLVSVTHLARPLILSVALVVPLVLRHRQPRVVFAVIAGVAFVQWLLGVRLAADAALIVALYTVASIEDLPPTVVAVVILEIGCILAAVRWSSNARGPGLVAGFVLLSGLTAAAAMSGFYVRTRRAYLLQLEDRAARLEVERDQQSALAVAAERERIARDMHDVLAHHLTVMVTVAEGAAAAVARTPDRAVSAMHAVAAEGRQALHDTRGLLGVLRDHTEDGGPGPMTGALTEPLNEPLTDLRPLDELVEQVRHTGHPVVLTVEGRLDQFPPGLPLTIYRLVQEALTNVMKHAAPGVEARVHIRTADDTVRVDITDDGPAASGPDSETGSGRGVDGMRERVLAWGGQFESGAHAAGWRVTAMLPCPTPTT